MKDIRKLPVLAWSFFWISAVTLGGGMAILPVVQREFVERRKWIGESEMVDILAVTHSLPGIIAINLSVLVGHRVCGLAGAWTAAFSAVLAPFLAILFVATGRSLLTGCPAVDHAFLGVRAAVTAMILLSAVKLAKGVLKDPFGWTVAGASFFACAVFGADVTRVVLAGFAVAAVRAAVRAIGRARG